MSLPTKRLLNHCRENERARLALTVTWPMDSGVDPLDAGSQLDPGEAHRVGIRRWRPVNRLDQERGLQEALVEIGEYRPQAPNVEL